MGVARDTGYALQFEGKTIILKDGSLLEERDPRIDDHFLGDTLNGNLWGTSAEAGATAAAVLAGGIGGVARLVSGAVDNETNELFSFLNWEADNGSLVFEVKLKLDAITTIAVCVGLSDALGEAAGEIAYHGDSGTATSTATDGVFWWFDTDMASDIWRGVGVKADVDTAQVLGDAPVAATYETLRIEVDTAGTAKFFQNGVLKGKVVNAVTVTADLTPYVAIDNRAAASRNLDLDRVFVGMEAD